MSFAPVPCRFHVSPLKGATSIGVRQWFIPPCPIPPSVGTVYIMWVRPLHHFLLWGPKPKILNQRECLRKTNLSTLERHICIYNYKPSRIGTGSSRVIMVYHSDLFIKGGSTAESPVPCNVLCNILNLVNIFKALSSLCPLKNRFYIFLEYPGLWLNTLCGPTSVFLFWVGEQNTCAWKGIRCFR